MRSSDLQIGDFVKYQGHIYIVEELSAKGWVHLIHPEAKVRVNMTSDYIIDLLEPIPLTPEILERNKIECVYTLTNTTTKGSALIKQIKHYSKKQDFRIIVNFYFYRGNVKNVTNISISNKDGINYVHSCEVEYVHELQNALRLCGLSDLADNFKLEE